jgi:hypothetical protein
MLRKQSGLATEIYFINKCECYAQIDKHVEDLIFLVSYQKNLAVLIFLYRVRKRSSYP